MASVRYRKTRDRWEVRKSVINPKTGKQEKMCRLVGSRTEADRISKQFDRRARGIKNGIVPVNDSVSNALAHWLEYNRRHTIRTQQHYSSVINTFISTLNVRSLSHLTESHIHSYINQMLQSGRKNRTCNAHLTVLKSFCRWFGYLYHLDNPCLHIKMLVEDPPNQRFLSPDEYRQIMEYDEPAFIERASFLSNTGLRATEFSTLRWANISPDASSLTVDGKGRKRRVVPLNSACRKILSTIRLPYQDRNSPIFLSKSSKISDQGLPVTRKGLYQHCQRVAKELGIPVFGPHALRHWFATSLLLKGVPIAHVSRLLGHSSIKTTEKIYIHITPPDLAGITECLIT